MAKKKLNKRQVKSLMKDEKKASKYYKKKGFKRISKDEKRHFNFFKKYGAFLNMKRKCSCDKD